MGDSKTLIWPTPPTHPSTLNSSQLFLIMLAPTAPNTFANGTGTPGGPGAKNILPTSAARNAGQAAFLKYIIAIRIRKSIIVIFGTGVNREEMRNWRSVRYCATYATGAGNCTIIRC